MTVRAEDLPTTPGSLATDARGRRYACATPMWAIVRWLPLTHWESPPPNPEQLAARNPTVEHVAPAWPGHREPEARG